MKYSYCNNSFSDDAMKNDVFLNNYQHINSDQSFLNLSFCSKT